MPKVAVAVIDGSTEFELGTAFEVFGVDRSWLDVEWYDFKLCTVTPEPIRTEAGFVLDTPYGVKDLLKADTIIVPAGGRRGATPPELLAVLRKAHAKGARIVSLCTGAFILAEAGLLDGRRATTHWAHAAALAAEYPQVSVDADVLFVEDGNVYTSAGTAAGIDLCLHLVRQDYGLEIANAIARRMVVPPQREGGQAQYVDMPLPACDSESLAPVLDWALANLGEPLSLRDIADRAGVSTRTLVRRFQGVTGTTPLQWLLAQRVRRAQHLLESSDEPVERIAELAGFGSPANLRQHFTRSVGVAPMAYRRCFRVDCSIPA